MATLADSSSTKPQAAPILRRRRVRFWLLIALAVVVLLPIVAFLGAVIYVRLGGLRSTIAGQLSETFASPARVGSVTTGWLSDLQIENVQIDATDGGKPLSVDAARIEWDLGPMLSSGRVRALRLEHPQLDLKQLADGRWNFGIKTSKEAQGGQIDQIVIHGGELSLELMPGAALRLSDLGGAFGDSGSAAPRSFNLGAVLPSGETFNATGALGPGSRMNIDVFGHTILERDWPALKTLNGKLKFDLSFKREGAGPVQMDCRLDSDSLIWKAGPERAVAIPDRVLQFSAVFPTDNKAPATVLNNVSLSSYGLSIAAKSVSIGDTLAFENGSASIDLSSAKAFTGIAAQGQIVASNLNGELHLSPGLSPARRGENDPATRLSGDFSIVNAHVAVDGMGDLPALTGTARLDWPALKATLALGAVGRAEFTVKDLAAVAQHSPPAIAANTEIQDVSIDLGQALQLLAAIDSQALRDLPVFVDGSLSASHLTPVVKQTESGPSISLSGLKLNHLALRRWTLNAPVPALKASGELSATLSVAGSRQTLLLDGKLAEDEPKNAQRLAGEFHATVASDEHGVWRAGPVRLSNVTVPWAMLKNITDVTALTGISGEGALTVKEAVIDEAARTMTATVLIDAPVIETPFPEQLQKLLVMSVRAANLEMTAKLLERYPIITHIKLTGSQAAMDVRIADGQLILKGSTHQALVNVGVAGGDVGLFPLPEYRFNYSVPLEPNEAGQRHTLDLQWSRDGRLQLDLNDSPAGIITARGNLHVESAGGKDIHFDVTSDSRNNQFGPATLSVGAVNAGELNTLYRVVRRKIFADPPIGGAIRNLKLELQPFHLAGLPEQRAVDAKITASLDNLGVRSGDWDEAVVSGTLLCLLHYAGGDLNFNTLATLEKYEALLGDGTIYIPPPPPGRTGSFKFACKAEHRPETKSVHVRIDNCGLNLGGLISADGSGVMIIDEGMKGELKLENVRVAVPDMQEASRAFVPPNVQYRQPWFETLDFAGSGVFTGEYTCDSSGASNLTGKINVRKGRMTIGRTLPLTLSNIDGDIPVIERDGESAEDTRVTPVHGTLAIGPIDSGPLRMERQRFEFTAAAPNSLVLNSAFSLETPAGSATISKLSVQNILGAAPGEPELSFAAALRIDADRVLRNSGFNIAGLETCRLGGPPLHCVLKRADAGGLWHLSTTGALKGPLFNGELRASNIAARGLFGPAPVFTGDLSAEAANGIYLNDLFERNGSAGTLNLRVNASVKNLEAASASLDGILAFDFGMESIPAAEGEYWFDGVLAMKTNRPYVRAQFPKMIFSDKGIEKRTFGIKQFGLGFKLRNGMLTGPEPKIAGDLILEGYGASRNVFANRFKADIKGEPGRVTPWADAVKRLRTWLTPDSNRPAGDDELESE